MYVQVRMVETGKSILIPTSRSTKIIELKELVKEKFNIKPENQRLFYGGKQLENQYTFFDYGININDVIQLIIRETVAIATKKGSRNLEEEIPCSSSSDSSSLDRDLILNKPEESQYFKVGDFVDVKDYNYGSWFVGKLVRIKKDISRVDNPNDTKSLVKNDGLIYVVEIEGCPDEPPIEVQLQEIRPPASEILSVDEVKPGDTVLMNYNVDEPKERGYWYDVLIKEIKTSRRGRGIIGDVYVGMDNAILKNCSLMLNENIFLIKPHKLLANRTSEEDKVMQTKPTVIRVGPLNCTNCKDDLNKLCKMCSCIICGGKDNEDKQLMCDECNDAYHMECLTPPLNAIPTDDWYCPSCKNDENEIVKAGSKLETLKKKSPGSSSNRQWGNGFANVKATTSCKTVPTNHFGPIPGIEVGTTWLFRIQVTESGIHRPPVGGIHGRDNEGAYSLVLSGGYEDDVDNGDEFLYTGSGGRDLSGNKRTAMQSCDQKLTRLNRALAVNCNTIIDNKKGATAVDWKKGKPIRVVRNYKLCKHSKYAPKVGNRYDGIYKVVKYYPEKGISGFTVWRFVLRRDDPTPAPWTIQGKKRIAELGLKIIYPENYEAVINEKSNKKRTLQDVDIADSEQSNNIETENISASGKIGKISEKKLKIGYELEKEVKELILNDSINKKYWEDCMEMLKKGKKVFLDRVLEVFLCICCQDIAFQPITTECSHNFCKECLKRSFNAQVFQCPSCRADLGKNYSLNVNDNLAKALSYLLPAYSADRQ